MKTPELTFVLKTELLRCPICHGDLKAVEAGHECLACGKLHPTFHGVPVILHEENSVFSAEEYRSQPMGVGDGAPSLKDKINALRPSIGWNVRGRENYARYAQLLKEMGGRPRVLVLGGRVLGQGMEPIAEDPNVELVETDICTGPRTKLICDAHDIPFKDGTFDGVIIQAVLEHVCDPFRCVEEIHRVMKPGGLIYAETPFMQQVHGRAWDFTRFTDLGHRRLFRRFTEIDRGACCGPGMALAWAWQYFLLSFSTWKPLRALARLTAEATTFWLKYLDLWLIRTPGTQDAASGYFFLGKRSDEVLSDRALIGLWRGGE
jgi:SAM-dependent methyltransferase